MKKLFAVILAAIMLFGCAGAEKNEDTKISESFSDEPAMTTVSDKPVKLSDFIGCKTHYYYGDGMYRSFFIRNEDELKDFHAEYKKADEIEEFIKDIDFSENALAFEAVFLSSGGYKFKLKNAVLSEENVKFDYELIGKDAMTDDVATLYLMAKVPVSLLPPETAPLNADGIDIIPFPRGVSVNKGTGISEDIDNFSDTLVYEEKTFGSWQTDSIKPQGKAVFISTEAIRRYYDNKMKCNGGVYTFKIGELEITLTKDYLSAENRIFGEVCRYDYINAIEYDDELLVEISVIGEFLSCGYRSIERLNENDAFMVKSDIMFMPNGYGDVNIGELNRYDEGYKYYCQGVESKNPKCERIAVNMRGNYICKSDDRKYFLEVGNKYYNIKEEMIGIPDVICD